jgi:hypothetical protein
MEISMRGISLIAAGLVAGAVAAGTARADTDWDSLSTAAWGSKQTDEAEKLAQASGGSGDDWSVAIQEAFVGLGMAQPRAECYGKVLAEQLSPEKQQAAAQLVRDASSSDEVKTSVISGGPEMVGGFSAADASCPESMGG